MRVVKYLAAQSAILVIPISALRPECERNPANLKPMEQRPSNQVLHMKEQYYRRRVHVDNNLAVLYEIEWQSLKLKLKGPLVFRLKSVCDD
jgi:hypothetical protein